MRADAGSKDRDHNLVGVAATTIGATQRRLWRRPSTGHRSFYLIAWRLSHSIILYIGEAQGEVELVASALAHVGNLLQHPSVGFSHHLECLIEDHGLRGGLMARAHEALGDGLSQAKLAADRLDTFMEERPAPAD